MMMERAKLLWRIGPYKWQEKQNKLKKMVDDAAFASQGLAVGLVLLTAFELAILVTAYGVSNWSPPWWFASTLVIAGRLFAGALFCLEESSNVIVEKLRKPTFSSEMVPWRGALRRIAACVTAIVRDILLFMGLVLGLVLIGMNGAVACLWLQSVTTLVSRPNLFLAWGILILLHLVIGFLYPLILFCLWKDRRALRKHEAQRVEVEQEWWFGRW